MSQADFTYDPVTAVDEASATGETAEIFADIRATMAIPLVTSIWRGLASMDDSLQQVWAMTRPIYQRTDPALALADVVTATDLPAPSPLNRAQRARAGLSDQDLNAVRTIVAAYNRSNGMNLVTLAALLAAPTNSATPIAAIAAPAQWDRYPTLLAKEEIAPETWQLVTQVNCFGAHNDAANVATLWRHLAHWPSLLSLVHESFAPLQASGDISRATAQMVAHAKLVGSQLAAHRGDVSQMSKAAQTTITGYVHTPTQVIRMVTLGHALARWLGVLEGTQAGTTIAMDLPDS